MTDVPAQLATANRILVHEGVLDGYGHLSVRDPADERHFLLARYLPPSLVTAEDVRAFDLTGQLVVPEETALYSERYIHAGIYQARPDVLAVCHTHAADLVSFGIAGVEPRPVFHMAASFGTSIPIFDEYDPDCGLLINTLDQAHRLAATLGQNKAALMRGHGAVVTGQGLEDVVMGSIYLAQNARIRLNAALLGEPVVELSEKECAAGKRLIGRPASLGRAWSHFTGLIDR
ncbi:MAG TPA: class II aldolase/adducin family protein [Pseudonocardiaceae bacterium]|jgi:HCOMODA/2-hydroxy-3-carboxy-muconic semialdehyde decarboxylase|nr:class II aldolase/adducin family protein [Pseudonocardiaceae bacterium]